MILLVKTRAELCRSLAALRRLPDAQLADALLRRFDGNDRIDDLIAAAQQARAAEIDACCCRTDRDWRRCHEARDRLDELRGELMDLDAAAPGAPAPAGPGAAASVAVHEPPAPRP